MPQVFLLVLVKFATEEKRQNGVDLRAGVLHIGVGILHGVILEEATVGGCLQDSGQEQRELLCLRVSDQVDEHRVGQHGAEEPKEEGASYECCTRILPKFPFHETGHSVQDRRDPRGNGVEVPSNEVEEEVEDVAEGLVSQLPLPLVLRTERHLQPFDFVGLQQLLGQELVLQNEKEGPEHPLEIRSPVVEKALPHELREGRIGAKEQLHILRLGDFSFCDF